MGDRIGVGIVGANPDRGWAVRAHLPAIQASPHFTLTAVATTRTESAHAARDRFAAEHAFTDAASLARHPDVDLVVVTVKVPAHVALITAAVDAGKDVYCEWPLTRTSAEAGDLAAATETAGVHAVVGLQARFAPAAGRARAMIAEGSIGTVLSATLYSSRSKGSTPDVPAWTAYTYEAASGAGLVEVLGGHALDLVQHLLGPIHDITARTALRSPQHWSPRPVSRFRSPLQTSSWPSPNSAPAPSCRFTCMTARRLSPARDWRSRERPEASRWCPHPRPTRGRRNSRSANWTCMSRAQVRRCGPACRWTMMTHPHCRPKRPTWHASTGNWPPACATASSGCPVSGMPRHSMR